MRSPAATVARSKTSATPALIQLTPRQPCGKARSHAAESRRRGDSQAEGVCSTFCATPNPAAQSETIAHRELWATLRLTLHQPCRKRNLTPQLRGNRTPHKPRTPVLLFRATLDPRRAVETSATPANPNPRQLTLRRRRDTHDPEPQPSLDRKPLQHQQPPAFNRQMLRRLCGKRDLTAKFRGSGVSQAGKAWLAARAMSDRADHDVRQSDRSLTGSAVNRSKPSAGCMPNRHRTRTTSAAVNRHSPRVRLNRDRTGADHLY